MFREVKKSWLGQTYVDECSWRYVSASAEYARLIAFAMLPVALFFMIYVLARALGGALAYARISQRKWASILLAKASNRVKKLSL